MVSCGPIYTFIGMILVALKEQIRCGETRMKAGRLVGGCFHIRGESESLGVSSGP